MKIMAREMVNYQQFLTDLEPGYDDCPEPCKLAEDEGETIDLPELCALCEVRTQFRFFRESFAAAVARRFHGAPLRWSFAALLEDVRHLAELDRAVKGRGYPRGVTALEARCLDLYRREQQRPRRIDLWQMKQERANRATRDG